MKRSKGYFEVGHKSILGDDEAFFGGKNLVDNVFWSEVSESEDLLAV